MSTTTVNLGMLPNNRGSYTSETWPQNITIYKDNIVEFNNSAYIYNPASFDIDNPAASATNEPPYDAATPTVLNTGWYVFASGNNTFTTGEKVDNIGIDDEPTAGSDNLVKSGGVANEFALGAVYDVSAKNPTAGPNNDGKWESLSALLSDANINTIIPTAVRKGGMSVKFVQSSDNKYIEYFLPKDEWSDNEEDWQKLNLEEEVSELEEEVYGLAPLTEYVGRLESTSPTIANISSARYMVVQVSPNAVVALTAGTGGCFYYVVSQFTFNPALPYSLVLATGETSKHSATEGNTITNTMPSDAAYIILRGTIIVLDINGRNVLKSLSTCIVETNQKVDEITDSVNDIQEQLDLKAEYVTIYGTNLINPSEVQLNKYIQYAGATGIFAETAPNDIQGAACSGLIPIEPGETYYLTRGFQSESSRFVFLKEDGSHTTAPLNPLTDEPMSANVCGGSQAFKAPSDAKYALICLAFSGWTDTETQIVGFQFEKGNTPTPVVPWVEPRQIIPFEHLPEELDDVPEEISNLQEDISNLQEQIDELNAGNNKLFVYDSDLDAVSYIESTFSSNSNIKQTFCVRRSVEMNGGHSECFNFGTVSEINTVSGVSTNLKNSTDDITPISMGDGGGYIGANHGIDKSYSCTVNSHGKTFADIGSVYSKEGYYFTIMDIVDENTLIILGNNYRIYPAWRLRLPSTGEYTHVSGGVNTSNFTVSSATMAQGKPVEKLDETFIYVDGKRITESGNYKFGDKVIISQNYKIANPASILSVVQSNAGSFTNHPNYSELPNVDFCIKLNISYIFIDAAHCFVSQTITYLQPQQSLEYFGFIQQELVQGSNIKMYIPKALPWGDNSLDFRTNPDYTPSTITETVQITSELWETPLLPPDRYIQNSSSTVFSAGYLFDYGVGGEQRKEVINSAFYIPSTSRKVYPRGIDGTKISNPILEGSSYSTVAFRIYSPVSEFNQNGILLANTFEFNNKLYIYADFNVAGLYEVTIPEGYIGNTIEVFERSSNVTLLTPISSNTILVKVDNNTPMYGYLVAQIKG